MTATIKHSWISYGDEDGLLYAVEDMLHHLNEAATREHSCLVIGLNDPHGPDDFNWSFNVEPKIGLAILRAARGIAKKIRATHGVLAVSKKELRR